MDNNNENNTSIIPISSTGLVKVSNSLAITHKILDELQQRFDPLTWWQTLDDNMKMALYATKLDEEMEELFVPDLFDCRVVLKFSYRNIKNLGNAAINNLDIGTIKSILQLNSLIIIKESNMSNIIPIKELTNLTHLHFNSEITDISTLTTLTNLTHLHFESNKISDISPLTTLTNLTYLILDDNKISVQQIEYLKNKLPNCHIYDFI
jgi:Leucine-rich repeat (LRR) protein